MGNFQFSALSETKLSTCHTDLILLAHQAIMDSPYDFKITEGHRSPQRQFELYKRGRAFEIDKWVVVDRSKIVTNIDGIRKMSNHNYNPARAFDIQVLVNGQGTWVEKYYHPVAEHILKIAEQLLADGKISHQVRWGGSWKSLVDLPHFEILVKP